MEAFVGVIIARYWSRRKKKVYSGEEKPEITAEEKKLRKLEYNREYQRILSKTAERKKYMREYYLKNYEKIHERNVSWYHGLSDEKREARKTKIKAYRRLNYRLTPEERVENKRVKSEETVWKKSKGIVPMYKRIFDSTYFEPVKLIPDVDFPEVESSLTFMLNHLKLRNRHRVPIRIDTNVFRHCPLYCPFFRTKLIYPTNPSLDERDDAAVIARLSLSLDYVQGNILITSLKAFRMRNSLETDQLKVVLRMIKFMLEPQ